MSLPESIRSVLPSDTATTWMTLAPLLPSSLYLGGGTAVAIHLGHRISRDLDFFYHHSRVDLAKMERLLSGAGPFAVTMRAPGTLNGVFSSTKVQFLHADEEIPQRLLEPPTTVAGINIASVEDLIAMKLKVIGDRGELRDYFDLMMIERQANRMVEEGLSLFLARHGPKYPQQAVDHIVRGLGYFDDVEPDELLPLPRDEIVAYWTRRVPDVVASLNRQAT